MERMKELIKTLNTASKAYYQDNRSQMSDREYDELYDELCRLEKETGIVLAGSPTEKVGYEVLSDLKKVRHDAPILSLDKTKEVSALEAFLGNNVGLLSWKLDGLTIVLKYNKGVLEQAITRGNGEIGEDITHNAKTFKNIPLKIKNLSDTLIIRGEAVISYSEFELINEQLSIDDKYKNPRNLTSGTVRQLNSEIAARRNVSFYAFSCVVDGGNGFDFKSDALEWLRSLGFDIVEYKKVDSKNVADAVQFFTDNVSKNDIATDGLVLTYDSIALSESLGATSKFPRDSIAFKWADEIAETTLLRVEWNASRTGLINPIAIFEPVELEGTTVKKASVHNVSILESLQLGIGDRIQVYKANMIIPQIADNLTRSSTVEPPKNCPVCNGETEIIQAKEGKALYCTNPNCKAQLIRSLAHFSSRDAMNIDGFSIQTIEKFVDKDFLNNYTDIFDLHRFSSEIKQMEGFGEKSYNKLIQSIENAKQIELPNFIYALGINQVGLAGAKLLCKHFDYDIEKIKSAQTDDLESIEGFGGVIANFIYKYFHNEENIGLLDKILPLLSFIIPNISGKGLEGLSFVITGDVLSFKNRKELSDKIESLGGKVTSSVTGKTSYLINNDILSKSSKNKKANELNIPIISEDMFIERFLMPSQTK